VVRKEERKGDKREMTLGRVGKGGRGIKGSKCKGE